MLPDQSSQPWPPATWAPFAEDIARWDRWYSGEAENLAGEQAPSRNLIVKAWAKVNGHDVPVSSGATQAAERRLHVPAAADIASTGADLLFGDAPSFTIAEAHEEPAMIPATDTEPERPGDPTPEQQAAAAAEARLHELIEDDGWSSTLVEGAEINGALGGVFLRPVAAPDVADHPILTVVHPDRAVPVFQFGYLTQVTFWQELTGGGKGEIWRHLEEHTRGQIAHGLYCGTSTELGQRRHLAMRDETLGFATDDTDQYGGGVIDLAAAGVDKLLAGYVPNGLPNRRHRTEPVGRSDYANCEPLLSALDEVWTSWVRDIRLAKARLVVPDEFLDGGGRGQGSTFNMDREIFSPLAIDPAHADKAGMTLVQFEIRNEEHAATAEAIFTQIIQAAGYSPQSFGMQGDGAAITATEVDAHAGRSDRTTGRKQSHWKRALEDVAESMLLLDVAYFGSTVTPMRPTVTFAVSETDPLKLAQVLNALAMAKAASVETMVRAQHRDWSAAEVLAEVARIQSDNSVQVGDPMAGLA